MTLLYRDGEILEDPAEGLPFDSYGAIHGRSVFETARTFQGRVPFWDQHRARMDRGREVLGIAAPPGLEEVPAAVAELLKRQEMPEGRVRVTVYALDSGRSTLVMTAGHLGEPPRELRCMVAGFPRNEHSPLSGIKSGNYGEMILAWRSAQQQGFDEAILLNTAGNLCEGSRHNLFLVRDGILITPDARSGILPGITRGVVLACAREAGLVVEERAVGRAELAACTEVILTNSVAGVVGATVIDNRQYEAGVVTALLRRGWEEATQQESG